MTIHSASKADNERHRYAFASLGESMEATRFFFADAAVNGLRLSQGPATVDKAEHLMVTLNEALSKIVEQYIRVKAKGAPAAP